MKEHAACRVESAQIMLAIISLIHVYIINPQPDHTTRFTDESTCEKCEAVQICSVSNAHFWWAAPWNEGVHSMYGLWWHQHTGNAVESLAKSTTSGSSSNMLFSIMFRGRLARSATHKRKRNKIEDSQKGKWERWDTEPDLSDCIHWHAHIHTDC